ncbi:GxxExxY protein [Ottowia pentelensis]|uniref:GxxExxY protein n=1 Tax=Ottowia pentelensis TaxID=511108 RepID=A0ABV6PQB9_9BURK|nr:GxxExxY protein [Ottowia sp.]
MMRSNTEQPDAEDAKGSQRTQKEQPNIENDCSHEVIGAAVEVQRVLGVGLLESAYANALAIEFDHLGLHCQREVPIAASYKGHDVGVAYRADFIVEDSIIVELKALDAFTDAHRAQLLTYLRLSGLKLGLLINFHTFPIVKGIQRLVNKL